MNDRELQNDADKEMAAAVATEILRQLGGNRFLMMTGAKNLLSSTDGRGSLSMRVGRNDKAVNYVKVTLTAMDLYDIEFGRIHGTSYKVKSSVEGIYNDQLVEMFEKHTGLFTHL